MSTPGHITITRGSNGPSTGAPGNANHVIWKPSFFRVCARRLLFWGLCFSLSSPRFCSWMCAVVGLHVSPRFSAVGALSPNLQIPDACGTADRQATCQVAATQAATSKSESAKMFVPLAAEPALVDTSASKVVSGNTSSGGKDAQTAVRKPLPWTCGEGFNLKHICTKDCWLDLVSSSVLSLRSPPAPREEGARGQQTQSQGHQKGKRNRRTKRKAERDNSLVGGLQKLFGSHSKVDIQW